MQVTRLFASRRGEGTQQRQQETTLTTLLKHARVDSRSDDDQREPKGPAKRSKLSKFIQIITFAPMFMFYYDTNYH